MSEAPHLSSQRILDFARSEVFERTFKEGMALVEETAAYLDGPGRAASKQLERLEALAYAGESMRLTTRLMQVASWLLVQRALRDGEMTLAEAHDEKYRFTHRPPAEGVTFVGADGLPDLLCQLMRRAESLHERVRRLDETIYGAETPAEPNAVGAQLAMLREAFGRE